MMDESFDGYNLDASRGGNDIAGNGWGNGGFGNQSFVSQTQSASSKPNEYDRVAIPVTVKMIQNLDPSAEKITYGNYSFSTVSFLIL